MGVKRRRKTGFRKTKRLFVVSTEGAETEPTYLSLFAPGREGNFRLKVLGNPAHKTKPTEVVGRLIAFEKKEKPGPNTEYWALIDRDAWTEEELAEAFAMVKERKNYFIALSNPCFEFWLFLHHRNPEEFHDRHYCQQRLQEIWPEYDKAAFDPQELASSVDIAIERASLIADNAPAEESWPQKQGTHVFRLIEKLKT